MGGENTLLAHWCYGHQLYLIVFHAFGEVDYLINDWQSALKTLHSMNTTSSISAEHLADIQERLGCDNLKAVRACLTRWLSNYQCADRLRRTLPAHCLNVLLKINNATADEAKTWRSLHKEISSFNFIASTYLLVDVLGAMNVFSRSVQTENIQVREILRQYEVCAAYLVDVKTELKTHSEGATIQNAHPKLPRLVELVQTAKKMKAGDRKKFLNITATDVANDLKDLLQSFAQEIAIPFVDTLLKGLRERFENGDALKLCRAIAVVTCNELLNSKNVSEYMNDDTVKSLTGVNATAMQAICDFFKWNSSKQSQFKKEHSAWANFVKACKCEYPIWMYQYLAKSLSSPLLPKHTF